MYMSSTTSSTRRPEIQALRAIAVMLVVGYHLRPGVIKAGYIGVDVFFVISGFLITSQLFREMVRTGTIRLTQFYARRVRRLLPAGFTVLLASAVFTVLWLPKPFWTQTFTEIGASALFCVNWVIAHKFLVGNTIVTPVGHYWSLSVEEQFYFVWPGLMLLTVLIVGRMFGRRVKPLAEADQRKILVPLMALMFVLSAATSVILNRHVPTYAEWITPTKVWEFAAGGLLALLSTDRPRHNVAVAALASWAGLAIIFASVWVNDSVAYPGGLPAAPVVGTVLVIWAGQVDHPWAPSSLMAFGPVQLIGDISYGVYLWQWPLIMMYPYVRGSQASLHGMVIIVAAALLLGWLSKVLIEDPIRTRRFGLTSRRRPRVLAEPPRNEETVSPALRARSGIDGPVGVAARSD